MSLSLSMDVHVPAAITKTLRLREVDVLTAQDDDTTELPDNELLDQATKLGRILFSRDQDLLAEAVRRQRSGIHFSRLVYAHQLRVSIRQCVHDLEIIVKVSRPEEMANRIEYLPIK